jgi:hypothetical protein
MTIRCGALAALLLLTATPALADDPYAADGAATGDGRLTADVIFGRTGAIERLRARLHQADASADLQTDGWSTLCEHDYHVGDYALGAKECDQAAARGTDANTAKIVRLLAAEPAPRAEGSARVPLSPGGHIGVIAGDYQGFAIADTGAQISVMMQSVAKLAHVRILGASSSVDTTTTAVAGQIGILPEARIGAATLRDLPVLVLPDRQLILGGGAIRLPFILGLYAMTGFGRVAWLDHGRALALGDAAPAPTAGAVPITWHPVGIGVPIDGVANHGLGGRRQARLDSGANLSYLYRTALPLLKPEDAARLTPSRRQVGGVGGVVEEVIDTLPRATLALAGHPLEFGEIDVAKDPGEGEAALLGEDVLTRYAAAVLDFGTMRFSVTP